MPCWYYEKKDFLNTPSVKQGMSPEEESKCRKDGAKFIIAACTKLRLNIVTCATGVVLFHRFYMFRSFKEFPKYITALCCLYLAGKVEETPKKCKDLIEVTKSLLTEAQFATFRDNPKEEITTLEQIVLQTVKIDFVIEHPYTYLVKFAKLIKGDKDRIQRLLQIAWTLNNDSLCTTLSLQWEPDVIAVSLMYLACRISKFEITDWHGKPLGFRGKWYNFFVEDVSLDLLEDICHQVLDNFCKAPQSSGHGLPTTKPAKSKSNSDKKVFASSSLVNGTSSMLTATPLSSSTMVYTNEPNEYNISVQVSQPVQQPISHQHHSQPVTANQYNQANPYISSGMYASSFMDKEGSQSIQSLVDGQDHAQRLQCYKYTAQPSNIIASTLVSSMPIQLQQNSGFSYQQIVQTLPAQSQPLVTNYLVSSNVTLPTANTQVFKDQTDFQSTMAGQQNKTMSSISYDNRNITYYAKSHSSQHSNWK